MRHRQPPWICEEEEEHAAHTASLGMREGGHAAHTASLGMVERRRCTLHTPGVGREDIQYYAQYTTYSPRVHHHHLCSVFITPAGMKCADGRPVRLKKGE